MKILHIVAGDLGGGAARGAHWLHLGLKKLGIDSQVLIQKSTIKSDDIIPIANTKFRKLKQMVLGQLDQLILMFYENRNRSVFSTGFFGNRITDLDTYKEADVVHLHWINAGMLSIKEISKIKKPIVWTFRDMWPFTGGCHCSLDCEKYKSGCGNCKNLNSKFNFDLSRIIVNRKKRNFKNNIYPVAISNWLRDCAKSSYIFRDYDIEMIHNGVDTNIYKPLDKNIARDMLNIPKDKKIVLIGAQSAKDKWKGFDKFLSVLKFLTGKDYSYLFFGNTDEEIIKKYNIDYRLLGFLYDNISLSIAYSSADIFVAPSIQEAFGKTLIEAMACGTPVVCFDATGPKDIVTHKETGYKAKPYDEEDLANGIQWVVENENYELLSQKARDRAKSEFDIKVIAKKYKFFYEKVLDKERRS